HRFLVGHPQWYIIIPFRQTPVECGAKYNLLAVWMHLDLKTRENIIADQAIDPHVTFEWSFLRGDDNRNVHALDVAHTQGITKRNRSSNRLSGTHTGEFNCLPRYCRQEFRKMITGRYQRTAACMKDKVDRQGVVDFER